MSLQAELAYVRNQFPALKLKFSDQDFVYLDSTNTTLKPQVVIDRIQKFYSEESSNVHRGGYQFSAKTTGFFERARQKVAEFLGAQSSDEIIFVRGTTEAINLVAHCLGQSILNSGDEILISEMEHHANIVPWHMLQTSHGIKVQAARIHDNGELDLEDLKAKLSAKTKLVALTACSNTLGTITPLKEISKMIRENSEALFLVDGAQLVTEMPVNVQAIDADFFMFSAHKIFGPTGIGALYAKKSLLDSFPPYQGGGSMISKVTLTQTTFNDVPLKFEAGTPHIEGVIGLHSAIEFVESIGWKFIQSHKQNLLKEATATLQEIPGLMIYGTAEKKSPILSFNIKGIHHSDLAQILDEMGIAVRAGHHCTQPLMDRYQIPGCVRASFSIYSTSDEIKKLKDGILKAQELLL
jgi:cysteine desulfurase/selenocysteine lyase